MIDDQAIERRGENRTIDYNESYLNDCENGGYPRQVLGSLREVGKIDETGVLNGKEGQPVIRNRREGA